MSCFSFVSALESTGTAVSIFNLPYRTHDSSSPSLHLTHIHQFQIVLALYQPGISVKTQVIFLIVFLTRYLDLFTTFYSLYNSVLKVTYIALTATIVLLIRCWPPIVQSDYHQTVDTFPLWKLAVGPCFLLALAVRAWKIFTFYRMYDCTNFFDCYAFSAFDLVELLWTFSIILESLAILPQLMVLRKYGLVENLTGKFVFFLGLYRLLYIANWVYRAHTEPYYKNHWLVYICGVLQTLLYLDFFFQYLRAYCYGGGQNSNDHDGDNEADHLVFEFSDNPASHGRGEIQNESASESLMVAGEAEDAGGGDANNAPRHLDPLPV